MPLKYLVSRPNDDAGVESVPHFCGNDIFDFLTLIFTFLVLPALYRR